MQIVDWLKSRSASRLVVPIPVVSATVGVLFVYPWYLKAPHDWAWALGLTALIGYPVFLFGLFILGAYHVRMADKRSAPVLRAIYFASFGAFAMALATALVARGFGN